MPRFSKPVVEDANGELIMPGAYGAAPGGLIERRNTFEWDNGGRALVNVEELSVDLSDDEQDHEASQHDEELGAQHCSNNSTNSTVNDANSSTTEHQEQEPAQDAIPTELLDATVVLAPPPSLLSKACAPIRQGRSRSCVVLFVALALALIMAVVWTTCSGHGLDDNSNFHSSNRPLKDDYDPPSELLADRSELGIQDTIARIISPQKLEPNWNSPYWEALYWILYEDPLQLTPNDPLALQQRFLLTAFYFATSLPSNRPVTNVRYYRRFWQHCAPSSNNSNTTCDHPVLVKELPARQYQIQTNSSRWLSATSECHWAGIQCNAEHQVTDIVLAEYGLTGRILKELVHLSKLTKLSLPYNPNLVGTIPSHFWTMLHTLELQYNRHSGSLVLPTMNDDDPSTDGWYYMDTNETLVAAAKNAKPTTTSSGINSPLEILNLAGNQFTGSIPTELETALTKIRQISLQQNQFTGNLPPAHNYWPQLEMLRAQQNQFSGTIPTTLVANPNLRELDLSLNQDLTGTIPSEIGIANKLLYLKLAQAQFTGTIPSELYQCTRLKVLDLHNNLLKGTMATDIGRLNKLRELYWQDNDLEGSLPDQLGELVNIEEFHINGNSFEGNVPESFCRMRNDGFPLSLTIEVVADCTPEEDPSSSLVAMECSDGCCSVCCQKSTGACEANPFAILGWSGNKTGYTP